jgi:hypothetical protein
MLCQVNRFWVRQFAPVFRLLGLLVLLFPVVAGATQSVTLTWDSSDDPNVVGYKIYYGTASLDYTDSVMVGSVTNATITGLLDGTTYYFAATSLDSAGDESGFSNEAVFTTPTPPVVNLPPTLDPLPDLTLYQNAGTQAIPLTGITSGSSSQNQTLIVSATSSNPSLVSAPAINYNSPDSTGTLSFAIAANAVGTAVISVTVNNGGASSNLFSQSFNVTVMPAPVVNQPPTLNPISSLTVYQNAGTQTIALSGISSGSPSQNQTLSVSAVSSNPGLIPAPAISYVSPNATGALSFKPATNITGTATINVTVDNGGASNHLFVQTFTVTVLHHPPTLNALPNLTINQNAGVQSVALSGITSGSANEHQTLTLTATTSNPGLVSTPTLKYASPGNTGLLTFRPVANSAGIAVITVSLKNGGNGNNIVTQSFTVTVLAAARITNSVTAPASLSVKPVISKPLTNRVAVAGQSVALSVAASGLGPLKYQWKLNGVSLPTATNATLAIKNITPNQAGNYSVSVSNNFGSANSTPAQLIVVTSPEATLTSTALANGHFSFQVSGVPGYKYVVQASSDLVHWVSVQTNKAPFTFQDTTGNGIKQRFYRSYYAP